jgi:hypothetical protein
MATVLDDLQAPGGETYLYDLSVGPGDYYVQSADLTAPVSLGATQEHVPAYDDQPLDLQVQVFLGAQQEYVAPPSAGIYSQDGALSARVFLGATQEYIPLFGGTYGQTADLQPTVTISATQQYIEGSPPGDFFQQANLRAPVTIQAIQVYDPLLIASTVSLPIPSVQEWMGSPPTEVSFDVSESFGAVSRITFTLTMTDATWLAGVGPQGGEIAVEVRMGSTPLVSLTPSRPKATFYATSYDTADRFEALRDAILAGEVTLTLGSYESIIDGQDRSLPLDLVGSGQMDVQVVS